MFNQYTDPVSITLRSIQSNSTDFHQGNANSSNTENRNCYMGIVIFCFFYILLFSQHFTVPVSPWCYTIRNSLSSLRFGADYQEQRNEAELEIINPQTAPSLGCFWQNMALVGWKPPWIFKHERKEAAKKWQWQPLCVWHLLVPWATMSTCNVRCSCCHNLLPGKLWLQECSK